MPVAFALAGGGSRGDFQVGVVQYLYEHLPQFDNKVQPDILCGTSSGSILAAKLCEGEDPNNPSRGLKGLIGFWHSLHYSSDMWNEQDWFHNLGPDAQRALAGAGFTALTTAVGSVLGPLGMVAGFLIGYGLSADDLQPFLDDIEQATTAKSLYNIDPVREMGANGGLNLNWMRVSADGSTNPIILRMTTVALESGALRYVDKFGKMWERDLSPVYGSNTLAEACRGCASALGQLLARYRDEEDALERGGAEADPLALSALAAQIADAEDALANCIAAHPVTPVQRTVNLLDGVIASASIPVAFPPVLLGNEHYVDGGVCDNLPIDAAIRSGATKVYAVCSSASTVPVWHSVADGHLITDYNSVNLLDITGRVSVDIMINEMTRQKTTPPNGWGAAQVIVIEPEFDLHDIMTIDAGLIRIAMGQGYMRADDVMQAYAANQTGYRALADQYSFERQTTTITKLRRTIWEKEYLANRRRLIADGFGRPAPASGQDTSITIPEMVAAQGEVRRLKRSLKTLLAQRVALGGDLPPGSDQWWLAWEEHDWTPEAILWTATDPVDKPLRHLQVAANILIIPPGTQVQFLVTAKEGGAAVNNAKVLVNGREVGVTGTRFPYTFVGRTLRVYDHELKRWVPELVDDEITVQGEPWWEYFKEPVACDFDVTPTRHAQIELGPVPASLTPGQTFSVTATVRNTGNVSWAAGAGYALGSQSPQDNSKWGTSRIPLPGPVAFGDQVTFAFSLTAPATGGSHTFQWQMFQEGVQWFGDPTPVRTITVVAPRAAEYVSQTVDNIIGVGEDLPTTWKVVMKNTGTETWTTAAGYALGSQNPQDNTIWARNRIPVPNSVAPGQTVTFTFTGCYAPTRRGTGKFQWQMVKGNEWFGPMTPLVSVNVVLE